MILRSEVERAAAPILSRLNARHGTLSAEDQRQIRAQAVQALIDGKLIEEVARRMGIEAGEEDVDAAVGGIAREEGVTVEDVYAAAERQGLPREQYRKRIAQEITRMKVISSAVRSRVSVSDDETIKLFEKRYRNAGPGLQVRVRHILLPWPPEASQEQREEVHARAQELRDMAIETHDFASVARQYSAAPSSVDGGLTLFREGDVAPELGPYAFGMDPGEVSPPILTRHGVNLLQVVERFDPSHILFEDIRETLRRELFERKTQEEFRPWLEELRRNRYIEVVAPELR